MHTSVSRTALLATAALALGALAGTPAAASHTAQSAQTALAEQPLARTLLDPDGNRVVVDDDLPAGETPDALSRPSFARAAAVAAAKAPKAKKKLKTLVIPVYWSGAGKDTSNAKVKKRIKATMKTADTYFRTVSAGRIGHATTVLGWQKIPRPAVSCGIMSQADHVGRHGSSRAKAAGKNPAKFDRVIFYVTAKACDGYSGVAGLGSMPGRYVWLEGNLAPNVMIHELGHNLGLDHSRYTVCSTKTGKRLIFGTTKQCADVEYGDMTDVMGNNPDAGWFGAPKLARLGWFSGKNLAKNTSTKKKTYTLRPLAAATSKAKAVRVKGTSGRYYWVEYRKRTGLDSLLSPGLEGVQIRLGKPSSYLGESAVLDMLPAPYTDWPDWHTVALEAGASWTSPEGIRFSVGSTGKTAKVTVQRKAGKAKKPSAPKVSLTASDRALRVSWTYPKDRGTPVQSYDVQVRSSDGQTRTDKLLLHEGHRPPLELSDLDPSLTYSIAVRAKNHRGSSGWSMVATAKPLDLPPIVSVHSPAAGATVGSPSVRVVTTPALPTGSAARITNVVASLYKITEWGEEFWSYAEVTDWYQDIVPGKQLTLDIPVYGFDEGSFLVRVEVTDSYGRTAHVDRPVTVVAN